MSSVWIVTDGEYSDYHIVAVFDSETAAKEHAGRYKQAHSYSDPSVEEHTLNAGSAHTFMARAVFSFGDAEPNSFPEYFIGVDDSSTIEDAIEDAIEKYERFTAQGKPEPGKRSFYVPPHVISARGETIEHAKRRVLELRDLAIRTVDGI